MKLKGYIFYKNGYRLTISEDRPSSFHHAIWEALQSTRGSPDCNVQGYLLLKEEDDE